MLHDSNAKTITVEALAPLIEGLQAMGAEILPIDQSTYPVQYTVLSKDTTEAEDTKDQEAEPAEAQPEESKEQENENQIQE